jgi:septum site-determining protein MinD
MKRPFIINVVSGKGGTGKTLLCAVLAEMLGNTGVDTLVVDLDIFVRGLTSLLYFHRQEALHLVEPDELTVADFIIGGRRHKLVGEPELGAKRYRSFDVLPSVATINERLDFRDLMPDTRDTAVKILRQMLDRIGPKYQIILLDSRAGYDELVSATHLVSDASICVEEDDDISRVTADNLVEQLQRDADTPLFRLTNKARDSHREREVAQSRGVTHIGTIPFDIDVMNSFGAPSFWHDINRSLYVLALVRAWDRFDTKLRLGITLRPLQVRPLPSEFVERLFSTLAFRDRLVFVYSILAAIVGIGYAFLDKETLSLLRHEPLRLTSAIIGVLGIVAAATLVTKRGRA